MKLTILTTLPIAIVAIAIYRPQTRATEVYCHNIKHVTARAHAKVISFPVAYGCKIELDK